MHATISKGIVGSFESIALERNLIEWHKRPWTYVCECKRKAIKVGSTATASGSEYLYSSCSYVARVVCWEGCTIHSPAFSTFCITVCVCVCGGGAECESVMALSTHNVEATGWKAGEDINEGTIFLSLARLLTLVEPLKTKILRNMVNGFIFKNT